MHRTINVSLSERSYPIQIGSSLLDQTGELVVAGLQKVSHFFVIVDQKVHELHGQRLEKSLGATGARVSTCVVPSGETSKSSNQLIDLWNSMVEHKTDRASVVVAFGGGVVGDLAGFAAASFARGLRFVQIPTTLLAQVDSSVGGKTGINLPSAKNMVGAFWQPSLVVIDLDVLQSLPDREYRSGLAEVVKYGVILDGEFFAYLEKHAEEIADRNTQQLQAIIARSCQLKALVVSEDERETIGRRAILNYGHTFGHAIETLTAYGELLHGEAVSVGMTMAAKLAHHLKMVPLEFLKRQEALLKRLGLPVSFPELGIDLLWETMQRDKKVEHGELTFILPTRFGEVVPVKGITKQDVALAGCHRL